VRDLGTIMFCTLCLLRHADYGAYQRRAGSAGIYNRDEDDYVNYVCAIAVLHVEDSTRKVITPGSRHFRP